MKENRKLIVIGLSISCGEERSVKFGVLFINCYGYAQYDTSTGKTSIYRTGKISPV